jgi:hypothetical protein
MTLLVQFRPNTAFERNSKCGAGCLLHEHGRALFEPAQFKLQGLPHFYQTSPLNLISAFSLMPAAQFVLSVKQNEDA